MRRWFVPLVAAAVLVFGVFGVGSANAGKATPFAQTSGISQWDHQVDQQSNWVGCCTTVNPVVNPTTSFWDINDHASLGYGGFLDPGSFVLTPLDIIWDHSPIYRSQDGVFEWRPQNKHFVGAFVSADSPNFSLSICFSPQGRCFSPNVSFDPANQQYVAKFCGQVVYRGNPPDPALQSIPGSNGGVGVPSTVTAIVTNLNLPGARRARINATGGESVSSDIIGCGSSQAPLANPQSSYPFTWQQS